MDVLVEFEGPATFHGYFDLKNYLEAPLGRTADLVTELHVPRILGDARRLRERFDRGDDTGGQTR